MISLLSSVLQSHTHIPCHTTFHPFRSISSESHKYSGQLSDFQVTSEVFCHLAETIENQARQAINGNLIVSITDSLAQTKSFCLGLFVEGLLLVKKRSDVLIESLSVISTHNTK